MAAPLWDIARGLFLAKTPGRMGFSRTHSATRKGTGRASATENWHQSHHPREQGWRVSPLCFCVTCLLAGMLLHTAHSSMRKVKLRSGNLEALDINGHGDGNMTSRKVPVQRELSMGPSLCRVLLVHSRSVEIPVEGPRAVLAQRLHTETVCVQALRRSGKEVWATRENGNENLKYILTDPSHYNAQTPGVILIPGPDISDQDKAPALRTGCGNISNPSHPHHCSHVPQNRESQKNSDELATHLA